MFLNLYKIQFVLSVTIGNVMITDNPKVFRIILYILHTIKYPSFFKKDIKGDFKNHSCTHKHRLVFVFGGFTPKMNIPIRNNSQL